MTLLELQRRMSDDVRRPLTPDMAMQTEAANGASIHALAETYIKPNDRLTSFDRLEIYNRQYWFRVITAVSEDYPALNALLREKKFDALVLAYLKENDSTSWTLRDLGGRLPQWLEAHPEFAPRRHKLMVDVARLEWAYIESYDGLALLPLTEDDFRYLAADSTLTLQPHLQLLALRYPVDELVLAVHKETPATDIVSNAVSERKKTNQMALPEMSRAKVFLAVHRYDNSVYYRRIEPEAFALLAALKAQQTLGDAIETAFAGSRLTPEEQAKKIQACFAHAAELGWFCREQMDPASIQ
jgi:hypothetical protein